MRPRFPITELCAALDCPRSSFYHAKNPVPSARAQANAALLDQIQLLHAHRHTKAYGSPRVTLTLKARGHSCSRPRIARLMRSAGLRARPRRPFRPKTTSADHAAHPSPNLLADRPAPTAPGQVLVSDITYVPTAEGWLYLAVVIDLFSRCVLGWAVADHLKASLVLEALESSRRQLPQAQPPPIFHSDRGCQYTSSTVRTFLRGHGWQQSMSAKGNCYDNAYSESFFASFKNECFPSSGSFQTRLEAHRAIFDYLATFYNNARLHSSLHYKTPASVFRTQIAA